MQGAKKLDNFFAPQGSTLGPLLFLLYINDLRYSLKFSTVSDFADDTSIIYSSNQLKTIETNLNFDLKCVSEWLKSNRLSLNVKKLSYYSFDRNTRQYKKISPLRFKGLE